MSKLVEEGRSVQLSHDAVAERIKIGINRLFCQDGILLAINASERAICHRLAFHIEPLFDGWNVDCEYNRDGHDHPKLLYDLQSKLIDPESSVFPDIIVHKRAAYGAMNDLLVIEVKKSTSTERIGFDFEKLRIFTTDYRRRVMNYNYRFGLFLSFTSWKKTPRKGSLRASGHWFGKGEQMPGNLVVEKPFVLEMSDEGHRVLVIQ